MATCRSHPILRPLGSALDSHSALRRAGQAAGGGERGTFIWERVVEIWLRAGPAVPGPGLFHSFPGSKNQVRLNPRIGSASHNSICSVGCCRGPFDGAALGWVERFRWFRFLVFLWERVGWRGTAGSRAARRPAAPPLPSRLNDIRLRTRSVVFRSSIRTLTAHMLACTHHVWPTQ